MRRQFTLLRLMISLTVFAFLFGLTSLLWPLESSLSIGVSFVISASLSTIILIAKEKDIMRIIWSVMFTGIGIFIGCQLFDFPRIRSGCGENDYHYSWFIGAIVGWIFGGILTRWDERVHRKLIEKVKEKDQNP
ncbi:MAG: hypothetical protein JXB10_00660 [Pirellulales bacterium]|nr:hypothetical protein [Pirellulales bacterium]